SPFGVHDATMAAPPLVAGVYLGRHWMIGVESGAGSPEAKVESDEEETHRFLFWTFKTKCVLAELSNSRLTNTGGFIRFLPNSTFFLGVGLHQRTWSGDAVVEYRNNCVGGNHDATGRLEGQARVGSFMLGNTWQFPGGF